MALQYVTDANSWQGPTRALLAFFFVPTILAIRFYINPQSLYNPSWTLLIIAALIQYQLSHVTWDVFFGPLRHIPMPAEMDLIRGHAQFMQKTQPPGPQFLEMMNDIPNDGLVRLRSLIGGHILVTKPELLMDILVTRPYEFTKPDFSRRFLRGIIGDGLVLVEGNEHRRQRKSVSPAFQPKHIRNLVPLFWQKSQELASVIAALPTETVDGKTFRKLELSTLATRVTLDIIGVAGLGKDFGTLHNSDDELAQAYHTILDPERGSLFLVFIFGSAYLPNWAKKLISAGRLAETTLAVEKVRAISKRLLAEKRRVIEAEKGDESQIDIMAVLIRLGTLSDNELVDQLLTFLGAGHETTSSALTWVMYLLAIHPEIQARLREEIKQKIPDPSSPIDITLLDSMPYLHAVCQETLRFYPTVPVTVRMGIKDTLINNVLISKNKELIISMWAINRAKAFWGEDAELFKPERWLGNDKQPTIGSGESAYSLMTFLHGPRSCIGQAFAKNELKCLVAALVGRFHTEMADPDEKIEPAGLVTIKPKNGCNLKMTEL